MSQAIDAAAGAIYDGFLPSSGNSATGTGTNATWAEIIKPAGDFLRLAADIDISKSRAKQAAAEARIAEIQQKDQSDPRQKVKSYLPWIIGAGLILLTIAAIRSK